MLHHCFTYRPLFKIYAWVVLLQYLHVSHLGTYLYWSLKKFHEVWNQKVTWNDKLYACLDYNGNMPYIQCELMLMQHTNATGATHLEHLWNNLVKHVYHVPCSKHMKQLKQSFETSIAIIVISMFQCMRGLYFCATYARWVGLASTTP
jgi:hypothetical protein